MKQELTAELLRECVDYDEETGVFYSKTVRCFGMPVGSAHPKGYIKVSVAGTAYLAHRLAWFFMHGEWPSNEIDHINGIKTDNRIINLRDVTHAENIRAHFASKRLEASI